MQRNISKSVAVFEKLAGWIMKSCKIVMASRFRLDLGSNDSLLGTRSKYMMEASLATQSGAISVGSSVTRHPRSNGSEPQSTSTNINAQTIIVLLSGSFVQDLVHAAVE